MSSAGVLEATARAMVAPRKGILAVDESTATCTKRFAEFGIESTEESRRNYREMMFTAPGIGEYVSGAILYDETIRQTASDGRSIVDVLNAAGIMPGIKVDTGAKPLAKAPGETVTEGLDGLRERLKEYREIGVQFTKWRAVLSIGDSMPSSYCIDVNAHALGRYAALAQEAGLVPIVEPEVLMGGDHDIERCREVTDAVLASVFGELEAQRVELDGIVLKPNMVVAGMDCPDQPRPERVAELTLETLRRRVPESVPGIAFLSGGMSGEEACRNLDAMNRAGPSPWELTYSFGRALQFPGLPTWGGKAENVPAAQAALVHRARMSSNARSGQYSPDDEKGAT
jgi:fructose-bisphosphate aldolase class I